MKTKFLSATLALSFLTPAAFADDAKSIEQQVLEALIVNSGQITLESQEGKELGAPDVQFSSFLAATIMGGYLENRAQGFMLLNNISLHCHEGPGAHGADQVDCNVSFLNGDFNVGKDGRIDGPQTESSFSFDVSAIRTGKEKVRLLGRKFKAVLAG